MRNYQQIKLEMWLSFATADVVILIVEACLHVSGGSKRFGRIEEGNTVSDYDPEIREKFPLVHQ